MFSVSYIPKYCTLLDFHKGKKVRCPKCGGDTSLRLTFCFALSKEEYPVNVIDVFLPEKVDSWKNEGKSIEFYPFMVIAENKKGGDRYVWLPYWHIVKNHNKTNKKYGQWAPFIDTESYNNMLSKAKKRGLL